MKKIWGAISVVLGIILLLISIYPAHNKNLDEWVGGYEYFEAYPRDDNEMVYTTENRIMIWKQNHQYYAIIQTEGWHIGTRTLACVSGDKDKIDIIFQQTLPGDSGYGKWERYEKGEVLVRFEREGEALITEWKALRDENHYFSEREDEIIGKYFDKKE